MRNQTRRGFLGAAAVAPAVLFPASKPAVPAASPDAGRSFPMTAPEQAYEIVRVSHFDPERVRELLEEDRSLCLASWDWGFGDWETALGAASHMGRKDIVEVLVAHGAKPNLFTLAMLDQVEAVRAICESSPGIQRIRGPHGITLLSHAKKGNAGRVAEYLIDLGGADETEPNLGLPEADIPIFEGSYVVPDRGQTVLVEKTDGAIGLSVAGSTPRRLRRTADHTFSPVGAPHVTIRFEVENRRAVGLTIQRAGPVLSARRLDN